MPAVLRARSHALSAQCPYTPMAHTPKQSGSSDGKGAIWAAQRVPDDHVCAVANWFTIGKMDLKDSDNFRASKDIEDVAKELGYGVVSYLRAW